MRKSHPRKQTKGAKPERIKLREARGRWRISAAKQPFLDAVKKIINDNRDFWPLTNRQIHYRLLGVKVLTHASKPRSLYRNVKKDYFKLCDLLTRARLEESIPWEALSDETRPFVSGGGYPDKESFIAGEIEFFLTGYSRDLLQSQSAHVELIGEKLTIEGIIRPVCRRYRLPFTIGRGYASLDPRYKLVQRFKESERDRLILLFLSDFDPAGQEIAHSFARSLRDDFGVDEIEPIQVALTRAQVEQLRLPPIMSAKETDANYDRFVEQYGETVHELEAIEPATLQDILSRTIESVIDMRAYKQEIEREKADRAQLASERERVREILEDLS